MANDPAVVFLGCLLFFLEALGVTSIPASAVSSLLGGQGLLGIQAIDRIECKLPPYPQNGKWKLVGGDATPGDKIPESSVIMFQCDNGYKLSSKVKYLICDEHWDSMEIPECEELCPPLYSSTTYELTCSDKKGKEIKCSEATNGTFLEYSCASFYETPFGYKKTFLCQNRKWGQKPVCLPVCGKTIGEKAKPLIYGSKPNEQLEYPWVVALYEKKQDYKNICGGSILSATVVLTAAHCVTDDYGNENLAENYAVGVGKLHIKYQAPEDIQAQYLQIYKIIVPKNFKANRRRFLADIAVLVTDGEFVFNEVIQPVCFYNVKNIHLHPGNKGEISGWGLAEGELVSDVLRTLKIPYKYETTCAAELPRDWADTYNMEDKICAGFVDQNTSVCDGDSGGGLAFKNSEDNRYYIHGLVSLGLRKGMYCDMQQNTLYTKVSYYYQFVDNLLSEYNPKIRDCKLPAHPKHGEWTTEERGLKPGDIVPSSVILTVHCDSGNKPSSPTTSIECGSSYYMPTCQKLCPKLDFPKGTFSQCTGKDGGAVHCSEAIDGTSLSYVCPPLYQNPADGSNERTCEQGSWKSSKPECVRATKNCGEPYEQGFKHPWTAGLYKLDNNTEEKYNFFCGASVISERVVLTAAQCVTDASGQLLPKENFMVAAGKVHVKYNDTRDVNAQYREVSHIVIHPSYTMKTFQVADLALLFMDNTFTTNEYVQAVCLPNHLDKSLEIGDTGVISRWQLEESNISDEPELVETQLTKNDICDDDANRVSLVLVQDKFCLEFSDEILCPRSDYVGKGFYRQSVEDGRYYIHGVASKPPEKCTRQISLTETMSYYDFLECILSKFYRNYSNSFIRFGK